MPDLALMVSDVLVAFDHLRHEVTILANVFAEDDLERAYRGRPWTAIAEVRERLAGPVPRARRRAPASRRRSVSNIGSDGYEEAVERVKEYIRAGDAYQVVPSQRWSGRLPGRGVLDLPRPAHGQPEPVHVLPRLRGLRDRRRVARVAREGDGPRVASSARSPAPGRAPGPPRRTSSAPDELLADEKERAEHVMLVDLARNDLGRVCEYGTVTVDELMVVETYSHVMHIVSTVSGRAARGVTAMDALRGVAARRDALRRAEDPRDADHRRAGAHPPRAYGGAVGYLSYTGDLDTCIYIRSAVVKDGRVHVQAGGGHRRRLGPRLRAAGDRGQGRRRARRDRAGLQAGGLGVRHSWSIDNYDSFTYNLVQYLGELGAEIEVVRNDEATCRRAARAQAGAGDRVARALHARGGRRLRRGDPRLRRGGHRRCSACASATRRWRRRSAAGGPRRAGARQDRGGRARRQDDLQGPRITPRGRPLPLAGRRPRPAGLSSRSPRARGMS